MPAGVPRAPIADVGEVQAHLEVHEHFDPEALVEAGIVKHEKGSWYRLLDRRRWPPSAPGTALKQDGKPGVLLRLPKRRKKPAR